ncbi:MAG: SBBP repeat-containing protein [Bacteroidetes bacterium]|nr:SBBP repeat-containing protein [Bacteroidota bacterium]
MKKLSNFLVLFVGFSISAAAQDIQWAKNYGNTGYGYDVAVDDNGNSYMVGSFDGASITFGGTTLTNANAGYGDIYVVKVNTSGTVVWAKRAGQTGSDYAYGVAVDKSGNVYVAGSYYNNAITFGATTLSNSGAADAFVVKYNSSGTVVWAKKAGGAYSETASSVAVDTSGNVLVTGYFESSSINIGSYALTNSYLGSPEVFVAKYNSAGTAQWAFASLGADFDFGEDISTDAAGNCFVVGTFGSNSLSMGGNTIYNASTIGTEDIFVMKVSSTGVVTWLNSFGGPAYEGGAKITSDNTGNVFISGNFGGPTINLSTTSLANYNAGTNDIFVAKLNTSGVVQWAKQIGSLSYEYFASLDVDRFGNVFVGGFFRGPELYIGNDTLYHSVGGLYSDIFITKLNTTGNPVWAYASGGTNDDQCTGVGVDYLGNCYIQGYFSSSSVTLGAFTLNSIGNSANPYLSKICSPTSKSLTQTACASYTLNGTTYTNSGVYTQTLTNQAGCDSVITLNLTINPSPTVSNTGTTIVCSGTPINIPLTASVASTFTWIAANNANTTGESLTLQTTSSIQNTIVCTNSNPHNVNYTITPTSITGSCPGTPKVYTVTVNPLPLVSFSGLTDSVCLNSSIQTLIGSPAGELSAEAELAAQLTIRQLQVPVRIH